MNVTIVGCGALGSVFAWHLADPDIPGISLDIIQRPGAHRDAIMEKGLTVHLPGGKEETLRIPVSSGGGGRGPTDLAIVLVKSKDTAGAAELLAGCMSKDGVVLTLQNGLGNAEILADILGPERIAAGVTTFGGYRTGPGSVVLAGEGNVTFGPWSGFKDLNHVKELFSMAGLNPVLVEDPRKALCTKLVMNAAINPLAAIVRKNNGSIIRNADLMILMDLLYMEAVEAMSLRGVPIDSEDVRQKILEALEKTSGNRASMLQDIEAGRTTEIDSISGQVIAAGEAHGVEFPHTRTVLLLVKAIENSYEI